MSEENSKPPVPLAQLVTFLAVISGVFWMLSPTIHSSRPYSDSTPPKPTTETADVFARLWQDPIGAVQHSLAGDTSGRLADFKERQLKKHEGEEKILLLPVMVWGTPKPEAVEMRLRGRIAVLAALGESGFTPEKTEGLGYFTLPWAPQETLPAKLKDTGGESLVVPFEACVANFGQPKSTSCAGTDLDGVQRVIVLWLDDGKFKDHPLSRLGVLREAILRDLPQHSVTHLFTRVIGPADSTTLRSMVFEAKHGEVTALAIQQLNGAHIYAARPTVEEKIVTFGPGMKVAGTPAAPASAPSADPASAMNALQSSSRIIRKAFKKEGAKIHFERTIAKDDETVSALVAELGRRGICVKSEKTHIALISEWDSFYGRSLPISFAAKAGPPTIDELLQAPEEKWPQRIHRFHYMRGLDGRLPDDRRPERKNEGSQSSSKDPGDTPATPQPEGRSQADYLVRLAEQLEQTDLDLRRNENQRLRAVGVLGGDMYDRVMVLTALRTRLPEVVFFTNSLDARLAHSSEWPATHNLVIASGYDLQFNPKYHRQVPPFRDGYQTSMFVATLRATNRLSAVTSVPRIYEVGREGFQKMPFGAKSAWSFLPSWSGTHYWLWGGIASLGLLVGWWSTRHVRGIDPALIPSFWKAALPPTGLGVAICAALAGAIVWFLICIFPEEPLSLLGGTSVWPSNALRLFAALLAVFFLIKEPMEIARNAAETQERFSLSQPAVPRFTSFSEVCRSLARSLGGWLTGRSRATRLREMMARGLNPAPRDGQWDVAVDRGEGETVSSAGAAAEPQVDIQKLWSEYIRRGSIFDRLERYLPIATLSFLLAVLIVWCFGWPALPARGTGVRFVTITIEAVASLSAIVLTHYVVDTTLLNRTFIKYLTLGASVFPSSTIEKWRTKYPTLRGDLLGDFLDIQLIAARTRSVTKLIWYPFIILTLLIASRFRYFDDWDWPRGLIITYALVAGHAIFASLTLRRAAEGARSSALERFRQRLLTALAGHRRATAEVIRELIQEVETLRAGAFAAFTQHPIMVATLLPSGGVIWVLLQNLQNVH